MRFDHEPLSVSVQGSLLRPSMSDERSQCSTQVSSARQPALRPCIYIALRCECCGSVRQAIPELPAHAVTACPECSQECAFVLLGSGLTSRNLPFHQVHIVEPTQWDPAVEGETNSS
jgi:hypothetical protein